MLKRLSLFIFLASFGLAVQAQDVKLDEILANYFENTGGLEKWKNLKTMKMQGSMSMQGMEFTAAITQMRPNKQRVDVDIQGQSLTQAYDGEDAWWLFPMQTGPDPQSQPAEMAEQMTSEKFEDEFIDYKEKGHTVELVGTQEVDGTETYEVKLTKASGDIEFHYFDAEYFVPIMQKSEMTEGPMKGQFVETYLSDYQEVDGMMIPHFMEVKMNGVTSQKITLKEVELNPEVDETIFSRPKKD